VLQEKPYTVLIQTQPDSTEAVLHRLNKLTEGPYGQTKVLVASKAFGAYDSFLWLTGNDPEETFGFIAKNVGTIPGIVRIETLQGLSTAPLLKSEGR